MSSYGYFPEEYTKLETAKIVVLPVPYDETSTWGKGADKGPEALFDASRVMELYDIETDSEVYRQGIYTAPPVTEKRTPEGMTDAVQKASAQYLDQNKFLVTVGGEHSVTVGVVRAHAAKYKNLSVLQFDAHSDLRDVYRGSNYNHACVMARVREVCPTYVQVGIRSQDKSELKYVHPDRIFYAKYIYDRKDWMQKAVDQLTDNVYITIDLDAFDPGYLPSTGTPEPGGMNWNQIFELLAMVVKQKNVVGFDVVELCPRDCDRASNFLAAKLIYKLLSYRFKKS